MSYLSQWGVPTFKFGDAFTRMITSFVASVEWKICFTIIKMVDAVVSYAVQELGDFLIEEVSLRQSLRENALWLRNELSFMQAFLKDAEKKQAEDHLANGYLKSLLLLMKLLPS